MIVRVDRAFGALRADAVPEPHVGQVGDHLVGVRVGRGAGAGLIDVDREMDVVPGVGDFLARRDDHLASFASSLPSSWFASAQAAFK